jgi:alpha-tubulin suppressor-like RCC1 family protein
MNSSSKWHAGWSFLLSAACITVWWGATAQERAVQIRVAAGTNHGVLLKADGSVWTWGANSHGQLGIPDDHAWAPSRMPGLSGVRDVAAGDSFSAAVKSDGTVWAWGENEHGELGNGSSKDSGDPGQVAGLTGAVAVAAGGQHSLALKSDGTVWMWGDDHAQIHSTLPQQAAGLIGVAAIAATDRHNVALKSDGTVWIWGDYGSVDLDTS